MKLIKEGCGLKSLESKYHTKSVHSGAYGRMDRNKPSYTITNKILIHRQLEEFTHPCFK